MTEEYIKGIIKETLDIPVFLGAESITYPAATLETQLYNPSLFGDGKAKRRLADVYVNLWYENKADRDAALTALTEVLDATEGITSPEIDFYYDITAKKFRAVFHFLAIPTVPVPDPEPEPEPEPEPDTEP